MVGGRRRSGAAIVVLSAFDRERDSGLWVIPDTQRLTVGSPGSTIEGGARRGCIDGVCREEIGELFGRGPSRRWGWVLRCWRRGGRWLRGLKGDALCREDVFDDLVGA